MNLFLVKHSTERGWLLARKQGTSDFKLVPENYVKILPDAPPPVQPKPQLKSPVLKNNGESPQMSSAFSKIELDDGQTANVKDLRSIFENKKVDDKEKEPNSVARRYSEKVSPPTLPKKQVSFKAQPTVDPFVDSFPERKVI